MLVVSVDPFQLHCASADVSAHFYVALLSPEKQKKKAGDHRKAGIEPASAALGLLTTFQRKEVSQHSCCDCGCQGSSLWVSPLGSLPCRTGKERRIPRSKVLIKGA